MKIYLWETRPHGINNWDGSWVRYGHHVWSKLYAFPILSVQTLVNLVGSFTVYPSHSLKICKLCPKWTGDILMPPVCAEDVITEVCEDKFNGHDGNARFVIHIFL